MAMRKVVVHLVRKYYWTVFLGIKVLPSLLVLSQRFFFFQSATKFFPLLPITPCNELNAIWPMAENQA